MTDPAREFLDEVAAAMSLPVDLRSEALQEIATHLADTAAALRANGMDDDAARTEAVRRLGDADRLGRDLTAARRPHDRMLAAAGAGIWAVLRTGIPTIVIVWIVLALAGVVLALASDVLGLVVSANRLVTKVNLNVVLGGLALDAGAFVAGSAAVRSVSRTAWRRPDEVRPAVLVVGCLLVAWMTLAGLVWDQSAASVVTQLAAPLAFAIGTGRTHLRAPGRRTLILVLILGSAGLAVSLGAYAVHRAAPQFWSFTIESAGLEAIGPWWEGRHQLEGAPPGTQPIFASGFGAGVVNGQAQFSLQLANDGAARRFSGFRLEAWASTDVGDGFHLLRGQIRPLTSLDVPVVDSQLSAAIALDRLAGAEHAVVAITGVGPDGVRYLLHFWGPFPATFHGTALEWIFAWAASVR